jgi:hypothetical protein
MKKLPVFSQETQTIEESSSLVDRILSRSLLDDILDSQEHDVRIRNEANVFLQEQKKKLLDAFERFDVLMDSINDAFRDNSLSRFQFILLRDYIEIAMEDYKDLLAEEFGMRFKLSNGKVIKAKCACGRYAVCKSRLIEEYQEKDQRIRNEAEEFRRKQQAKLKRLRDNHKWISEKGFRHLEKKLEKEFQKKFRNSE